MDEDVERASYDRKASEFELPEAAGLTLLRDLPSRGSVVVLGCVNSISSPPCTFGEHGNRRTLISLVDQSCRTDEDVIVAIFENTSADCFSRPICVGDVVYLEDVGMKIYQGKKRGAVKSCSAIGFENVIIESSLECTKHCDRHHPKISRIHNTLKNLSKWWRDNHNYITKTSTYEMKFIRSMPAVAFPYATYHSATQATIESLENEGVYNLTCRIVHKHSHPSFNDCAVLVVEDGTKLSFPLPKLNCQQVLEKEDTTETIDSCGQIPIFVGPLLLGYLENICVGSIVLIRHLNVDSETAPVFELTGNHCSIVCLHLQHEKFNSIQCKLPTENILNEYLAVEVTSTTETTESEQVHNEGTSVSAPMALPSSSAASPSLAAGVTSNSTATVPSTPQPSTSSGKRPSEDEIQNQPIPKQIRQECVQVNDAGRWICHSSLKKKYLKILFNCTGTKFILLFTNLLTPRPTEEWSIARLKGAFFRAGERRVVLVKGVLGAVLYPACDSCTLTRECAVPQFRYGLEPL